MAEPVRWGVLGAANIATGHVILAMQQASLATFTAIASRTLSKAQEVARRFGASRAYSSYDELLADPEIEAVYIPLPNALHAEWSIKAIRAGKHVLCEKPLTMDAAEARQVQQVRDETGRYCLEAFAYRFNPVVARTFEIARSGVLGELKFIHTSVTFAMGEPDPKNVRLLGGFGGGAMYDVGCYAINTQRMVAGREPIVAWATMNWSERFDVDMSGTAMLDFGDGLRGTLNWGFETSYASPPSISGTKGRLIAPFGWRAPEGKAPLVLTVGRDTQEIHVTPADDYTGEVQDLSEAIRGLHPPVYVNEPLDANMRVIDACYKSYRSGKAEEV